MTTVEITFLGTTAAVPTKRRNHASIYLRYQSENEFHFLFDCGEGTQRQMLHAGTNFMRINDIFITHWHADHWAGLIGLIETMNLEDRKKHLHIYAPESEKFLSTLLSIGYASKGFPVIPKNVEFEGRDILTLVEKDEFMIQSIPAKHSVPAVAYAFVEKDRIKIDVSKLKKLGLPGTSPLYKKLKTEGKINLKGKEINLEDVATIEKGKRIVYSGDTQKTKNIVKLATEADILIHDSTYFSEEGFEGYNHTGFQDVMEIAKEAKVKQVILTHISRRYQDNQELKDIIKDYDNVRIAEDFMKVSLSK